MRAISIVAALVTVAATVVLCLVVPANRVISVGDDASALKAFKFYGYPPAGFSLCLPDARDGRRLTPTFFCLGDPWYLLIWHDDRIASVMRFQYVPREHEYGDRINRSDFRSFTIPRSNLLPYFVGLTAFLGIGWAAQRLGQAHPVIQATAVLVVVLGNMAVAGSMAMFQVLVSLGWAAALVFGANVFRSPCANRPLPQEDKNSGENLSPLGRL
jgi:hypothetical protein